MKAPQVTVPMHVMHAKNAKRWGTALARVAQRLKSPSMMQQAMLLHALAQKLGTEAPPTVGTNAPQQLGTPPAGGQ